MPQCIGTDGPTKVGQMETQLNLLGQEIQKAHEIQRTFRGRLESVLRPEPAIACGPEEKAEGLVPLAAQLRDHVRELRRISEEYEAILALVEI